MADDRAINLDRREHLKALLRAAGGAAGLIALNACAKNTRVRTPDAIRSRNVVSVATVLGTSPSTGSRSGELARHGYETLGAEVVVAEGCISQGDGGGGLFFWNSAGAVDDGGINVVPGRSSSGGAAAGCWTRIHSGPLNVKWFGAGGDGSAPDDAAIQAAIQAATGFDASSSKSTARRSGTIFVPIGNYKIEHTLLFVGDNTHTLGIVGELGSNFGNVVPASSAVFVWHGSKDGTLLELRGLVAGIVENVDFDGRLVAAKCVWLRSDQPAGGGGSDATVFRRCSFLNVSEGSSSVAFLVGDASGGTYQVDNTVWDHCKFFANQSNQSQIRAAACWRTAQAGNTKNFAFYDCNFGGAQYGIDWEDSSGCITVESCHFANFGLPSWAKGQQAACLRLGNSGISVVRACEVECNPDLAGIRGGARFITSAAGGISSSLTSLTVEGCTIFITMPSDNVIIEFPGKMTLIGNGFYAGWGSSSDNQNAPRISCGAVTLSSDNRAPVTIFSLNNFYPFLSQGSYAPLFEGAEALLGPESSTRASPNSVWSIGDTTVNAANTACFALQPAIGPTSQGAAAAAKANPFSRPPFRSGH